MTTKSATCRRAVTVAAMLLAGSIACAGAARRDRPVVRITGSDPVQHTVASDALAVYVHKDNLARRR